MAKRSYNSQSRIKIQWHLCLISRQRRRYLVVQAQVMIARAAHCLDKEVMCQGHKLVECFNPKRAHSVDHLPLIPGLHKLRDKVDQVYSDKKPTVPPTPFSVAIRRTQQVAVYLADRTVNNPSKHNLVNKRPVCIAITNNLGYRRH